MFSLTPKPRLVYVVITEPRGHSYHLSINFEPAFVNYVLRTTAVSQTISVSRSIFVIRVIFQPRVNLVIIGFKIVFFQILLIQVR